MPWLFRRFDRLPVSFRRDLLVRRTGIVKSLEVLLRIFLRASLGTSGFSLSSWWIRISLLVLSFTVRLVPLESALAGVTADKDVLLLLVLLGVLGVVLRGNFGGGGNEGGAWRGCGARGGVEIAVETESTWWLVAGRCFTKPGGGGCRVD